MTTGHIDSTIPTDIKIHSFTEFSHNSKSAKLSIKKSKKKRTYWQKKTHTHTHTGLLKKTKRFAGVEIMIFITTYSRMGKKNQKKTRKKGKIITCCHEMFVG